MGNTQAQQTSTDSSSSKTPDQKEEEEESRITCEICIEPIPGNKKFKNKKRCAHSFCTDCIAKYIEAKMEEDASEVKCPGLHCEKPLDPISCRSILPQRQFERWCDVLCETAVLKWERVYCPYQDCSALILNECGERNVKKTKCPNCKKLLCYLCKIPWHEGVDCERTVEMRERNEILFAELAQRRKWTRCPICKHCVELVSGCPVVRCRFASFSTSSFRLIGPYFVLNHKSVDWKQAKVADFVVQGMFLTIDALALEWYCRTESINHLIMDRPFATEV
ncbi:probable E3 ubiquitin-protein ligase RNF217 [Telopea speciosissima]|uniref:probable E3 ubiquitin-protein ligase RNF217 n=1 Tax=Telopea speciosissima TaxID=54955 RepID=UPI001CC6C1ED|nr:probable E3 ubiquitin-protein ligase RNF217 [Telopea speciosissima]